MLGLAAFKDICERRIPNRLTGALAALYPVYVLVSPTPVAWPAALGLAPWCSSSASACSRAS